jgi:hypothetical protein
MQVYTWGEVSVKVFAIEAIRSNEINVAEPFLIFSYVLV